MSTSTAFEEKHAYLVYSITYYAYSVTLIYSNHDGGWGANLILYHSDGKSPTRIDIDTETYYLHASIANYAYLLKPIG